MPMITCNVTRPNDAIQAALGSATALDGCDGAVQVTSTGWWRPTDGCMMSQTRTFTAVDECGNQATEAGNSNMESRSDCT